MKKLLIWLIRKYQKYISKWLTSKNINCKYYPSCSEYMIQAIDKYGVLKGLTKGFIRILRCNPFARGGYDPLK
ncbi:MAG: membrane protein insertion efficiency factor YidD [Clostridia bacterium]|nr:membrane protein insertion efficiency factor YidD [Clostridia bacterium]